MANGWDNGLWDVATWDRLDTVETIPPSPMNMMQNNRRRSNKKRFNPLDKTFLQLLNEYLKTKGAYT